jgi:hypothetical protein
MTDITERLRSIYVAEGANYVQEAADLIDNLRAERDQLVNDVHSCHAGCAKAGCVNRRLRDALESIKHDSEFFSASHLRSLARIALEKTK